MDNDDINQIDLSNLDYHIMQGNSLVEDFNGINDINQKKVQGDLFENSTKIDELINKIHDIQNNFSVESNYKRKNNLKLELEDSIIDFLNINQVN